MIIITIIILIIIIIIHFACIIVVVLTVIVLPVKFDCGKILLTDQTISPTEKESYCPRRTWSCPGGLCTNCRSASSTPRQNTWASTGSRSKPQSLGRGFKLSFHIVLLVKCDSQQSSNVNGEKLWSGLSTVLPIGKTKMVFHCPSGFSQLAITEVLPFYTIKSVSLT